MPKPTKSKVDKVYVVLSQIENSLNKQNSIWRVFILGLFRGLGTAIGATILLAIITSLALQFSDTLDVDTILVYFFDNALVD
jgi:hypothetical protein